MVSTSGGKSPRFPSSSITSFRRIPSRWKRTDSNSLKECGILKCRMYLPNQGRLTSSWSCLQIKGREVLETTVSLVNLSLSPERSRLGIWVADFLHPRLRLLWKFPKISTSVKTEEHGNGNEIALATFRVFSMLPNTKGYDIAPKVPKDDRISPISSRCQLKSSVTSLMIF